MAREVEYTERLTGGALHQRAGVMTVSFFSLEDVFTLLNAPYPQIDADELEAWVRTVMNDKELADRIKEADAQDGSDRDRMLRMRDLVGWRLIQCRQAA